MKKSFFFSWLDRIILVLGSVVCLILIAAAFCQVFCRFILGQALSWPEEVCFYLFMWCADLGMILGMSEDRHIRVDMLLSKVNFPMKRMLNCIAFGASALFCLVMLYLGYELVWEIWDMEQEMISLPVPVYLPATAVPICFGLTFLQSVRRLFLAWNER